MGTIDHYSAIVERVLAEYARIPYAYGEIETETVFDAMSSRYLLVNVGWDKGRRVHGCLVHIDIIDGKLWIQQDGTEDGIALELEQAGIPKSDIVLGFRAPELRKYTDYAVV
jgi:hypothetical protein